jgi:hypothetical protein
MLLNVRKPPNYLDIAVSLSQELAQAAKKRDAQAEISEDEIQKLRESGLLELLVPQEYGGTGATWVDALKIVYELSKAEGSIGQLYGNHLNLTVLSHLSGTPQQTEKYYRYTAKIMGCGLVPLTLGIPDSASSQKAIASASMESNALIHSLRQQICGYSLLGKKAFNSHSSA